MANPGATLGPCSCGPTANVSIPNGVGGGVSVQYRVAVYPVSVVAGGTTPYNGAPAALTGQPLSGSLVIGGTGFTGQILTSSWSKPGGGFKNYDPKLSCGQLVPLSATDLSQPALSFYDGTGETLTLTDNATVGPPTGVQGSTANVTASSTSFTVLKPTASWPISTGTVQYYPPQKAFGLYNSPAGSPAGVYWHNVVVTVPPPFSGGSCTFTQTVTPNVFIYDSAGVSTAYGTNNGLAGLDGSFDYQSEWSPSSSGEGDDSPAVGTLGLPNGTIKVTASETFTSWVMYKPSVGVWVPINSYNWNFSETFQLANGIWSLAQASPTTPPAFSSSATVVPPIWSLVH